MKIRSSKMLNLFVIFSMFVGVWAAPAMAAPTSQTGEPPASGYTTPNGFFVSPPVSPLSTKGMQAAPPSDMKPGVFEERQSGLIMPKSAANLEQNSPDPVAQIQPGPGNMPAPIMNFDGIDNTGVLPPDTDGQIGKDHYVQIVNASGAGSQIRVWDKETGVQLYNFGLNYLWPSGSRCNTYGYGDPVVLYDQLADRWLLTQFTNPPTGPYNECIAVSKGPTPTNLPSDWYLYQFDVHGTKFNDYPKIGVWPDGYYMMAHQFTSVWEGTGVWVFDRAAMLTGGAATFQYKDLADVNINYGGMMPSNLMGNTLPPAGSPNYFVEVDEDWNGGTDDIMHVFAFHVDWATPANTTFTVADQLTVAPLDMIVCSAFREQCIDQPGSPAPPRLEAIGDRLMMHAWYRNFGGYETIVVNQTVDADGADHAGIRWYELRKTVPADPTAWSIYQQSTYAPDTNHRWMGSIAMDHVGNIALGYSVSSTSVYPSVRYTGRLNGDPLGVMTQSETEMVAGGGSQTHSAARWGDYSAMSVDPVDDCTFWYTQEYIRSGETTWATRVGSFKFPSCAIGEMGTLEGTVTDGVTLAPIEGATIFATDMVTRTGSTTSEADGTYSMPLLVGTYDVTASAYGYQPETVSGVDIVSGTITTQDFALTPAAMYTVDGYVTDSATGWPLYAKISIGGYPGGPIWTDPVTGYYSIELSVGVDYIFNVEAWVPGYNPASVPIGPLTADTSQDFALDADQAACVAPGYELEYVYEADFEAGDGGFTVVVTGTSSSWAWGAPTSGPNAAHSGANVWATNLGGDYSDGEDGYITSGDIDLSAYAGKYIIVEWWQWLRSETDYDFASVQASNDGGATWNNIYGEVSGPVNETWAKQSVGLGSSYAVSNFRIRFRFRSDGSVVYPGWYIDDLSIAAVDITPPPVYASENFNGSTFPPTGWTVYNVDGAGTTWERSTANSHSSPASARHLFGATAAGNQDGWLRTPQFSVPAGDPILSFWEYTQFSTNYEYHGLLVCTSGCDAPPANYTEIAVFGSPVDSWRQQTVSLASYAGQSIYLAFRYQGTFADSWYIDDISLTEPTDPPTVVCAPQPGGLVVGNVFDANNGAALTGAYVANEAGESTTAAATEDPAVSDAFYTLFSPDGSHEFIATMNLYTPDIQNVAVVAGDTVRQDFHLRSGFLEIDPPALSSTLELGQSEVQPMTLSNTGSQPLDFEFVEMPQQMVTGMRVQMPDYKRSRTAGAKMVPDPARPPRNRPAYEFIMGPVFIAAANYNVLILTPDVGANNGGNVDTLLAALAPFPDLTVSVWDADSGNPTVADLLGYNVVIIGNDYLWNNMDKTVVGNVLADYIDAGGKVIEGLYIQSFDDWGFGGRYMTGGYSPLTPASADNFVSDSMNILNPAHPIMAGVSSDNDLWGHQDPGLAAGAELVTDWSSSGYNHIAVNANAVAFNQLLHHQANWTGDVGAILHNSILWLSSAGEGGVPWLAEEPISGTIAAGDTQPVDITFDAAAVAQPGDYHATLRVSNNTPLGPAFVPVTLTVTAPADFGQIAGTVTSLGYCDDNPAPADGAELTITSSGGMTWTVTADDEGAYNWYLDQDGSPFTVLVNYPNHEVGEQTGVAVTAGGTSAVNFDLRLIAPCASTDPAAFDVGVVLGRSITLPMAINNGGAAGLDWRILETPPAGLLKPIGPTTAIEASAPAVVTIGDKILSTNPAAKPGQATPARKPQAPNATTITQSLSQTIMSTNSIACNFGGMHTDNSYMRAFVLEDFGILTGFAVTNVEIGIESAIGVGGDQPAVMNLYTLEGPFLFENLTLIGTANVSVGDQSLTILNVPVTGNAPPGSTLVVEFFTPNGQIEGNSLFVGSNNLGETAPTYLAAAECGVTEPTTTADIGFPGMNLVMNVTGELVSSDVPWLSESQITGTLAVDSSDSIDITFTALPTLTVGAPYHAILRIANNDPMADPINVPVTMTVIAQAADVNLGADQAKTGFPGDEVTYTITVTNEGNIADTFDLQFDTNIYTTTLDKAVTGELQPGETETVQVVVTIPADAQEGDRDIVVLAATSQFDAGRSDIAKLTTWVGILPPPVYILNLPVVRAP